MRTATWASLNRMEHPPVMVDQLVTALKTTKTWRDALSLSAHVTRRAIEDNVISATRAERQALDMPTPRGRERRGALRSRRQGKAEEKENAVAVGGGSSYNQTFGDSAGQGVAEKFKWRSEPPDPSSGGLVTIGPNGVARSMAHGSGDALVSSSSSNSAAPKIARIDVLDCTFGAGHHSRAILEGGDPFTRVVALDCDLDVAPEADALAREFGPKRFRFFANHMSNALSMFGERKFDFAIVDPGPNAMQLFDPSRGFVIDPESNHSLDMRYSAKFGTPALKWLAAEDIIQAATSLSSVGLLPYRTAHLFMMLLKDRRPFSGSSDILGFIGSGRFGDLPEDTWVTQKAEKDLTPAMRFMLSLRAVINNEVFELDKIVRDSMLLLRPHGHLAVITRHPWERRIVQKAMEDHPYGLLAYSQRIEEADVAEFGVPFTTQLHLYRVMDKPAAILKNNIATISAEERAKSSFIRMAGMHTMGVGKESFPAKNFTFNGVIDDIEAKTLERNAAGPLADSEWAAEMVVPEEGKEDDFRIRHPSKRMPHH